MNQARGILIIGSLIFLGIGAWCLIAPRSALQGIGIQLLTADAAADARALYGGLDLAIGIFLAWCALQRERLLYGTVCMTLSLAGLTLGRAFGLFIEWPHINLSYILLAFEAAGAAAGAIGIWLVKRSQTA